MLCFRSWWPTTKLHLVSIWASSWLLRVLWLIFWCHQRLENVSFTPMIFPASRKLHLETSTFDYWRVFVYHCILLVPNEKRQQGLCQADRNQRMHSDCWVEAGPGRSRCRHGWMHDRYEQIILRKSKNYVVHAMFHQVAINLLAAWQAIRLWATAATPRCPSQ